MKKITILMFVLIFAVTLAFTACGGEKVPDVTEGTVTTTTEAAATTTEAPATTTKAITTKATTTTTKKVTTTTVPVPTTTAVVTAVTRTPAEPKEKVANVDDYRALYVQDEAVLLMDFYSATPDLEIPKSMIWEDMSEIASERFSAPGKMYADYIWYVKSSFGRNKNSALYGGTCAISYPHKDSTGIVSEAVGYYMNGSGTYAKTTYPSYFGDGYLGLGFQSNLHLSYLQKDFNRGAGYTIQVFASFLPSPEKDSVSSQTVFMFGPTRISISASEMDIIFMKASSYNVESNSWAYSDAYLGDFYAIENYAPVVYTISLTNPPTSMTEMTDSVLDLYLNTLHVAEAQAIQTSKANEGTFKIGEGADTQLYAVRIYKRTLTDAEVKQNYFADMALYFGLDISGFSKLSAAKKTAAYEALASVTTNTPKADVVAAYKAAIK